jgi:hypothetical protein
MSEFKLSELQIRDALADVDELSRAEYGLDLASLLADPDPAMASRRLKRLTGVLLKREFAHSVPLGHQPSETNARRAWVWDLERFTEPSEMRTPEFALLDELRQDLPRQRGNPSLPPTFQNLIDEADHERGLFKVFALWLGDKLTRREGRSFKDYFGAREPPLFEAALDASTLAAIAALGPLIAPFVPVPAVLVSVLLIGIKFGYRSVSEADERGDLYQ